MWAPPTEMQWHHSAINADMSLWEKTTGAGVVVGIYDTGVDLDHPDLAPNIRTGLSYSSSYGSHNGDAGAHPTRTDAHGTAVAGIIAAKGNGEGTIGVAPNADIVSVDWYDDLFSSARVALDAIEFGKTFDVTNWSIAFTPAYGGSRDLHGGGFGDRVQDRVDEILEEGRDGLGTIMVKAAGNTRSSAAPETSTGNAQADWMNQMFGTIVVSATTRNGEAASYSSYGSNVLVAGPAASGTSDPVGISGAAEGDYRNSFSGTSAAAPVVSGVAALMVSANPDLGWRDVQNILALSASHTGSSLISDGRRAEAGGWTINGAENWNGGGMGYHASYGYGMVDARAAVAMAESWDIVHGDAATSHNLHSTTVSRSINQTVSSGSYAIHLRTEEALDIEHIELRLDLQHNDFSEFYAWLVSPDGTRYMLNDGDYYGANVTDTVTFTVAGARGMSSVGTWRVEIEEQNGNGVAELNHAELTFFGAQPSQDDVYYFTDDFDLYQDHEHDRDIITDSNGGADWLHMAARSEGVVLDLSTQDLYLSEGQHVQVSGFEHVLGGNGHDTIRGDASNNQIYTGHGDDTLDGGRGADTLNGGSGTDFVNYFGSGTGVVVNLDTGLGSFGWAEGDRLAEVEHIRGTGLSDHLTGDFQANMLIGGVGDDRIDGRGNHDVLIGGDGDDHLIGGGGNDVLSGGGGLNLLEGDEGNDRLVGGGDAEHFFGGIGNDQIFAANGDDQLFGDAGDDTLNGGQGQDRIAGGAGNDRLTGEGGADQFVFDIGDGQDVITDFEIGQDHLVLSEALVPTSLESDVVLTDTTDGMLVAWSDGSVLLEDIPIGVIVMEEIITIL